MLLILLAVGLPIARLLVADVPRQRLGSGPHLAPVAAAYPVWLGASLELFRFRAVWVIFAIVAVGVIGWRLGPRAARSVVRLPWHETIALAAPGSRVLARLPDLPHIPADQSGQLASVLGRRETDGARSDQRHRAQRTFHRMTRGTATAMSTITTTGSIWSPFCSRRPASQLRSGSISHFPR